VKRLEGRDGDLEVTLGQVELLDVAEWREGGRGGREGGREGGWKQGRTYRQISWTIISLCSALAVMSRILAKSSEMAD